MSLIPNAKGIYTAPGFTDMHVHVFGQGGKGGINAVSADSVGIRQGVLTVVDAGGCGIDNYAEFKETVIDRSITNVKFFVNIARCGLLEGLSELADMSKLTSVEEMHNFKKQNGEHLVGIKVRMSASVLGESGIEPLIHALEVAEKVSLPLMVHIGSAPPALGDILKLMRKGDIVTHCFHGKKGGVKDFWQEFSDAVARGVNFDVGHGVSSFSYDTAMQVLNDANFDFTISTDIYENNFITPVGSLMLTMSKFFNLGFSLEEIVHKVTDLPARILSLNPNDLESYQNDNFTLFSIDEKKAILKDSEGREIFVNKIIQPRAVIKAGKVVWSCE